MFPELVVVVVSRSIIKLIWHRCFGLECRMKSWLPAKFESFLCHKMRLDWRVHCCNFNAHWMMMMFLFYYPLAHRALLQLCISAPSSLLLCKSLKWAACRALASPTTLLLLAVLSMDSFLHSVSPRPKQILFIYLIEACHLKLWHWDSTDTLLRFCLGSFETTETLMRLLRLLWDCWDSW